MTNLWDLTNFLPNFRPNEEISEETEQEARAIRDDLMDLTPARYEYVSLLPLQECPWEERDFAEAASQARKWADNLETVIQFLNKLAETYENRPHE